MDKLAQYNKERWEALAKANIQFSYPFLDLDKIKAWGVVDEEGILRQSGQELAGKDVLCLASGGGQQSVAFGLLGANVTVFDLSDTQLERDKLAAKHYNLTVTTKQGDMRDLSIFTDHCFDIVWHAYSINFVPNIQAVFNEVQRILRPQGMYRLMFMNPFIKGVNEEDWTGTHYPLKGAYIDGLNLVEVWGDPNWTVFNEVTKEVVEMVGPHEFLHTLSTIVNSLIQKQFSLLGIWEHKTSNPTANAGTWEHFKHIAPPWLTIWATKRPI